MTWAKCSACGETFGSDSGFEKHRLVYEKDQYEWRCASPSEMEARGLHRDGKGWWRGDSHFGPPVRTETAVQAGDVSQGGGAA